MESQKLNRQKANKRPVVVDNRTSRTPKEIDISAANKPIRCVNFVEVGDMDQKQVQLLVQELAQNHSTASGGVHYFLAVRNGKISTDVLFEKEIVSNFVNKICEVKDGQIVLKGGAKDIEIIRQTL